jgi:hypothetical protein
LAIKIELQKEAKPIFQRMAKEAGMGTKDLAEIACYNLIAIYIKEHGVEIAPDIFAAEPNPPSKPGNLSV